MNFNILDPFRAAHTPEQIIKRASRCPIGAGFNIVSVDSLSEVTQALREKYPDRQYSTRRLADGYTLSRVS